MSKFAAPSCGRVLRTTFAVRPADVLQAAQPAQEEECGWKQNLLVLLALVGGGVARKTYTWSDAGGNAVSISDAPSADSVGTGSVAAGPAAVAPSDAAADSAAGSTAIDAAQAPPDMLNRFLYNNMLHWRAQNVDALLKVYQADRGKLVVDVLRFLEHDDQFQQVVKSRVLFPAFKALFYLLLVRTVVNKLKQTLTRENLNRLSTDLESCYNGNLAESIRRMCGQVNPEADVSDDTVASMLAPARELEELHRITEEALREQELITAEAAEEDRVFKAKWRELEQKIKEEEQRWKAGLKEELSEMADNVQEMLI